MSAVMKADRAADKAMSIPMMQRDIKSDRALLAQKLKTGGGKAGVNVQRARLSKPDDKLARLREFINTDGQDLVALQALLSPRVIPDRCAHAAGEKRGFIGGTMCGRCDALRLRRG